MSHYVTPDHISSEASIMAWAAACRGGDRPAMINLSDPLELDRLDDPVVLLTHRQLGRLVFVAAETGARLAREACDLDPVAWMSAPRRVFEGSNAVTACTDRQMFIRALVLHGACPSLDINPEEVDLLLEDAGDLSEAATAHRSSVASSSGGSPLTVLKARLLFTACVADESASGTAYVFYAAVAASEDEVRDQLRSRAGARLAYMADVELGFDASEPIAMALLSDAMADLINHVAEDPSSQLSAGFRLFVEHRFED